MVAAVYGAASRKMSKEMTMPEDRSVYRLLALRRARELVARTLVALDLELGTPSLSCDLCGAITAQIQSYDVPVGSPWFRAAGLHVPEGPRRDRIRDVFYRKIGLALSTKTILPPPWTLCRECESAVASRARYLHERRRRAEAGFRELFPPPLTERQRQGLAVLELMNAGGTFRGRRGGGRLPRTIRVRKKAQGL